MTHYRLKNHLNYQTNGTKWRSAHPYILIFKYNLSKLAQQQAQKLSIQLAEFHWFQSSISQCIKKNHHHHHLIGIWKWKKEQLMRTSLNWRRPRSPTGMMSCTNCICSDLIRSMGGQQLPPPRIHPSPPKFLLEDCSIEKRKFFNQIESNWSKFFADDWLKFEEKRIKKKQRDGTFSLPTSAKLTMQVVSKKSISCNFGGKNKKQKSIVQKRLRGNGIIINTSSLLIVPPYL